MKSVMEVIVFEKESYYKMIDELTVRIFRTAEKYYKEDEWIGEAEAKQLLGIKSKGKMQQLRDQLQIDYSKFGKTIRYSRSSILNFLEMNRISIDTIGSFLSKR
ncbi:MAG: DNA-binding protein [Bacteroidetes bacterium]|nr:MAG: DNA-binding protein [Bacteroidota bacterium]